MPPMGRGRPLARAAMVGGTAYLAGRAGAKAGARKAAESAEQSEAEAAAAVDADAPTNDEKLDELERLKQLLDAGILTQAEYDAQKTRILATL